MVVVERNPRPRTRLVTQPRGCSSIKWKKLTKKLVEVLLSGKKQTVSHGACKNSFQKAALRVGSAGASSTAEFSVPWTGRPP